jgi:hypothetical protein
MMAGSKRCEITSRRRYTAGLTQEAAAIMSEIGGDEWGSRRSTLSRNLK